MRTASGVSPPSDAAFALPTERGARGELTSIVTDDGLRRTIEPDHRIEFAGLAGQRSTYPRSMPGILV